MRTYKREYTVKNKKTGADRTKVMYCYDVYIEGKRHRKCGFAMEREARAAAEELISQSKQGLEVTSTTTFKEYYRGWLTRNKKNKITKRSFSTYVNALNQFTTFFGEDKLLNDIDKDQYIDFINWYAADHAAESTRKINNCLKSAFEDAQYSGHILRSPAYKITYTAGVETQPRELKYIEVSEFFKLKEHLKTKSTKSALLLYVLVITGARFSEINNIEYEQIADNGFDILKGKTTSAARFIDVPTEDIKHVRSVLGKFKTPMPFDISSTAVTKVLEKALSDLNIKRVTIHALRHTHCSVLISKGVNIHYISRRLGHANPRITLSVYSHLLKETEEAEKDKTVKLLSEHTEGKDT